MESAHSATRQAWTRSIARLSGAAMAVWLCALLTLPVLALSPPAFPTPSGIGFAPLAVNPPWSSELPGERNETGDTRKVTLNETWEPLSDCITETQARGAFPRGFQVPRATNVKWRVTLTVANTTGEVASGVAVGETLAAELMVDPATVAVSPAPLVPVFSGDGAGPSTLRWRLAPLAPGATARLSFVTSTRTSEAGLQEYVRTTTPEAPNWLTLGARLTGPPGASEVVAPRIPVWIGGDFLKISLAATRLDWQIRKPGSFLAGPLEIQAFSNKSIEVSLSGLSGLAAELGEAGGSLPATYQFSADRPGTAGWLPATGAVRQLSSAAETGEGVTWRLWSRLEVGRSARAGEYGDTATLTFAVRELQPALAPPSLAVFGPGEKEVD